jgi:flagellar hook-associated protein 2
MASVLSASGLSSGIDTASIVDKLVQLESQPVTRMQSQQSALNVQVSTLGSISSKLAALRSASDALGSSGTLGVSVTSKNTTYSAVAGSGALAGRYSVQVASLAKGASALSAPFASGTAPVRGGSLQLTVMGTTYDPITIQDGQTLADVKDAINGLGAPISAAILNDGTSSYLSITNLDTGYPVGQAPSSGLSVNYTASGTLGTQLNPTVTQATNAALTVNSLTFTRQSNTITDAIPGVTFTLQAQGAAEDLVLANDVSATQKKLQSFADAYNGVMGLLNQQLQVKPGSDASTSLSGSAAVSGLKRSLQALTSTQVPGSSAVRSLADLGFKTSKDDGTLSIDSTVLTNAIGKNPVAVNSVFSNAASGIAKVVGDLVKSETDAASGTLTLASQGLTNQVKGLDSNIAAAQLRIDAYRSGLEMRFAAMEKLIAGLKSTGTFLTQASSQFGLVKTS